MQYSADDLVRIAKRDNNTIRPYLYVNPLQGKHIPSRPEEVWQLCQVLAERINEAYPGERLYVIGFAETATGIASAISHCLNNVVYYQNTTRESGNEDSCLYFTESHSHATNQILRINGVQECLDRIDRIVFIDDEVTTGKTILKLIDRLSDEFDTTGLKFSIVSIINSMTEECARDFLQKGIDCLYILKLPFEYKRNSLKDVVYEDQRSIVSLSEQKVSHDITVLASAINPREICVFKDYDADNQQLASNIIQRLLRGSHFKSILLLGTEEFMYAAFCVGKKIEEMLLADEVYIHATTRSPIIASGKNGYPLYSRYQIRSMYEKTRITYLYNLRNYDKVIIVTDSKEGKAGESDLVYALKKTGNIDISIVRWEYGL